MQKDLSNHSINDLTLRLHDELLARTQQDCRTIPRILPTRWLCCLEVLQRVAGKPANSFVIVVKLGSDPWEDEQFGILSILQGLTIGEIFLRVRTSSGCLENKLQTTDGVVWTVHPQNAARTELHSMITMHHADTRGSRAGRLRIAHCWLLKQLSSTSHVSFLATPETIHKHKSSLTYFTCLSDDLSNTHKTFGTRWRFTLRCSTTEGRINTNPISHKSWSRYCWTLRFSFLFFSMSHFISGVTWSLISQEDEAKIFGFSKNDWAWTYCRRWILQKRVLRCPSSSMYCAANTNRGKSFFWESEFSSSFLTVDIPELLAVSGSWTSFSSSWNSPCLVVPEFGTEADSRWRN